MTRAAAAINVTARRAAPAGAACVLCAVLTALTGSAAARATPAHPHDDIVAMVEGAALTAAEEEGLEGIDVRVHPLDPRLRPALCDQPLEIVRPHAGRVLGPVSYGVRCSGRASWTLYLRAQVTATLDIPVLRHPLPRGALIGENDIEMTTRRITARAVDLILDPAQAVGQELQRPLGAGSALRHGQVALPQLVTRGQTVTLVAGTPGLEVRMKGKAMTNGAQGDRVQVTNVSSGRRIEGVVRADGSVRIR